MGFTYEMMCETFKEYTRLSSLLTNSISDYFVKEGLGVTVSVVDEIYIELLYKPPRANLKVALEKASLFYEMIDKMPELFGLEAIRIDSRNYKKLELEEEFNTFYIETVLLRGVKNG